MKRLSQMQFRNKIVIIGVEPLGHFQRHCWTTISATVALSIGPPSHRKIGGKINLSSLPLESLRHDPQQHGCIEHLIVKAEVIGGNEINASSALASPIFRPDGL